MTGWSPYAVEPLAAKAAFQDGRRRFTTVSHTSHVDSAAEIVRARQVRPGLVFDKSILNTRRILVAWASPNNWDSLGYRYGNIRFDFDFEKLIVGKRFFWVEAIDVYSPHAPRILITDQDRSKFLVPYDPAVDDGPWLRDPTTGLNYFNGYHTLEFMFEGPIVLDHLTAIRFVNHSEKYCSISSFNPDACSYLGKSGEFGGARFLARCVATKTSLADLVSSFVVQKSGNPSNELEFAFSGIARFIHSSKQSYEGGLLASHPSARALARAILGAYSFGLLEEARQLSGFFQSADQLELAVAKRIGRAVGLTEWQKLVTP